MSYLWGIDNAHQKTNFKVIDYSITDTDETLPNNYIFQQESSNTSVRCYVILHETKEVYIIAPLYHHLGKIKKDILSQKIIPKDNVLTTYYDDIQALTLTPSKQ